MSVEKNVDPVRWLHENPASSAFHERSVTYCARGVTWKSFQSLNRSVRSRARHRSVLLLAFQRGYLRRVTSPVHRYLLDNGRVRDAVQEQYLRDLREDWMTAQPGIKRHQRGRAYLGRIAELQFAEWIEEQEIKVPGAR